MANLPLKGALADETLAPLANAYILLEDERILAVGEKDAIFGQAQNAKHIKIGENHICLPGYIDSHTHICFGGTRARDYAMRNGGKTYLEIAKEGGGIWDTVTQTRKASQEQLEAGIVQRAQRHLEDGVTTIEVKSGYGLSVAEELKMLYAIKNANVNTEADLISTCLAAHIKPKDYEGSHEDYLNMISSELFPILLTEKLTQRIDAFIEEEAFSAAITTTYLKKAKALGFDITIHADQFHPGGSEVAVNCEALSADHLETSTDAEIALLAKSNVIATALPGASMGLGVAYTPARKILDAGGAVSIASDWNPGSAPMGDLVMQASVLGCYEKLSNAEVLAGITTRAAAALNLKDRGQLAAGFLGDLIIYNSNNYQEICYQQGKLKPAMVFKKGQLVYTKK
jgi:imidazolonepropionase